MLSCNIINGYGSGDYVIYHNGKVKEIDESKNTPRKIVGYVRVNYDTRDASAFLSNLRILKKYRKSGYATKLLKAICEEYNIVALEASPSNDTDIPRNKLAEWYITTLSSFGKVESTGSYIPYIKMVKDTK